MGMDIQTRDFVVHHLRQAENTTRLVMRDASSALAGYLDFNGVLGLLADAQAEIGDTAEATRDPLVVVGLMGKAIPKLKIAGEPATPSAGLAIKHMQAIIDRLQPAEASTA